MLKDRGLNAPNFLLRRVLEMAPEMMHCFSRETSFKLETNPNVAIPAHIGNDHFCWTCHLASLLSFTLPQALCQQGVVVQHNCSMIVLYYCTTTTTTMMKLQNSTHINFSN
jgi:hypothetical protein